MQITQKGNSKKEYDLHINVKDYDCDPILAPFSAFRKVISYIDDTEPVHIDSTRIMAVFSTLHTGDAKYYFYMLGLLVRNDIPIVCEAGTMRDHFKIKWREVVSRGIERLLKHGLIFKAPNTRGKYLINPVYAWKGNRLDYLNLEAFEDCT